MKYQTTSECRSGNYPCRASLILLITLFTLNCNSQVNQTENDWAQWMGRDRKAIWQLDLKKESLAKGDLVKKWEVAIGTGYSGPTVSDGKVYLMDLVGTSERVLCFDAETGRKIWSHEYACDYSVGYPTGPRASVLIEDSRVYSLGTMGDLYCLDPNSGQVLWHLDGEKEYNISMPIWGLASSPIIVDDLLIVQIGGRPGACIVALHKKTGKEAWRALSDDASYSSPILIEQAGKSVLVCWTGDHLVGLNPDSGQVYWELPYKRKKSIINIAMPVVEFPYLFLSSFYDGSMLIRLDDKEPRAELVWKRVGESERKTDALHCVISTPFIQENYIYGVDSYGEFRCLDLLTGDRIWSDSTLVPYGRWSNAHFVKQAEKIWAFNEKGELILGKVSPDGFADLGRTELVKPVSVSPNPRGGVNWAHPAFTGRMIYARSDALLVCYELLK